MKIKLTKTVIVAVMFILIVIGVFFLNIHLKENNLFIYSTGTHDKSFLTATWGMSPNEVNRANKSQIQYKSSSSEENLFICFGSKSEESFKKNNFSCYVDEVYLFGKLSDIYYHFFKERLYKYEVFIPVCGYSDVEEVINSLKERFGTEYTKNLEPSADDIKRTINHPIFDRLDERIESGEKSADDIVDLRARLIRSIRSGQKNAENLNQKDIELFLGIKYGEGLEFLTYEWNTKKEKIEISFLEEKEENPFDQFAEKEESPFSKFKKEYELHITAIYLPTFNEIEKELREREASYF